MFLKRHKGKIIALIIIALLLSSTYFAEEKKEPAPAVRQENKVETTQKQPEITIIPEIIEETIKTEEIPIEEEKKETVCTFVIRCDTILNNMDKLKEEKHSLVPGNGIILAETKVVFSEGESVFDILLRETRTRGIHFEYIDTPMYNSVYIEGINNLYEKDCGELSGWMYTVNGEVPDCGCSLYYVKEGDRIELVYSCNMGKDI